jgi:hypothetical protein
MRKFSDGFVDFCLIALWLFSSRIAAVGSSPECTGHEEKQRMKQHPKKEAEPAMTTLKQTATLVPCPWVFLSVLKIPTLEFLAAAAAAVYLQSWLGWARAGLCNHPRKSPNPGLRFARFGYHHLMHPAPVSDQPRPPVHGKCP